MVSQDSNEGWKVEKYYQLTPIWKGGENPRLTGITDPKGENEVLGTPEKGAHPL